MSWGAERRGRFEQAHAAKQEPQARTRHDGDFDEEEDLAKLGRVGASTFISRASALACMLVLASFANAADITVSGLDNSGTAWVFFEGNIVLSDATQFQQKTSTISDAIVVMHSDGGKALAGIEIGKIIRLRKYKTLVPDDARCASACAIAWLGGTTRYMVPKRG